MNVLFFGIAKDIVGSSEILFSDEEAKPATVAALKKDLIKNYPEFLKLKTLAVAVNSEYANDDVTLSGNDEIAIIPPVSGG
ncbi:MoaD/ThiS family protein [Maribacter confluentis]|uniref:Molybdopterin synthase sulfur carrier subunit n=2 Tax=Maribacter TaxID=252356 RepID=A0ABY1SK65_9FLAO|nr:MULTISPECIES: MoaD/ThiS family protein [Maribacter]MDO1498951.1 MoaD/ThiS family protein [Winogradskyella maritima]MDO1514215.1 MoaD/ThiS family protein [Maribacter confluentis]TVZ17386.1 molybdopterin synthase sulfur carrier subunit [Maribacter sp. MAR_2009_72]SNR68275.1 molybdopterin synthase sulfur carrier subunit [Maribacter sedimenticola]